MSAWIDFKELRAKLDYSQVLAHYGVEPKPKGDQHTGPCPLPGHGANRSAPSFSANLARGIFQCFGCHAKGNVLDFCALMEGKSPKDGRALKQVAIEAQRRFCSPAGEGGDPRAARRAPARVEEPGQLELPEQGATINAPLDFELKGLDPAHPYFADRGLSKGTVERFGLGFCARGSLAGRIAIPIRDRAGYLVGYAGRVVDDSTITPESPCYLLPESRERNGRKLEFRKDLLLYNAHALAESAEDLIMVADYPSVWWLSQCGFGRAVATLGEDCSEAQAAQAVSLTTSSARIIAMADGSDAGTRFAITVFLLASPHRAVRWVSLDGGRQPAEVPAHELKARLTR